MADGERKITIGREERNQIIGTRVTKGSIVRVKEGNRVIHIVITDIDREWYEGAKIILNSDFYNPSTEVLLVKGEDAIYRNSNYKVKVRVLAKRITGLKYENFIQGAGGTIVGKVINDDTLRRICKNVYCKETENEQESRAVSEETAPVKEVGSQLSEDNMEKEEQPAMEKEVNPDAEPERVQEQSGKEPEEKDEQADKDSQEEMEDSAEEKSVELEDGTKSVESVPRLDFEKVVSESKDVEALISNLGLAEYEMLKEAVECAIRNNQGKLKKLLVTMHVQNPRLNQNAIRLIMNQDFSEWIAAKNIQMIEFSVSYMLKSIVKGMR